MPTKWRDWLHDQCDACGDDVEVKTTSAEHGTAYDGDSVRCVSCGATGQFAVDDDIVGAECWISWE